MSTQLNTVPAQEIKRRGVAAFEDKLRHGPVHVLRRNQPVCVVLSEEAFQELVDEAAAARLAASLADVRKGRVRYGTAAELMREVTK
jgi:PHD/YefM family antitoxin component YafN of YafNO toxin-antitoxin module